MEPPPAPLEGQLSILHALGKLEELRGGPVPLVEVAGRPYRHAASIERKRQRARISAVPRNADRLLAQRGSPNTISREVDCARQTRQNARPQTSLLVGQTAERFLLKHDRWVAA